MDHEKWVEGLPRHLIREQTCFGDTGWTPLHYAAFFGEDDRLAMILTEDPRVALTHL